MTKKIMMVKKIKMMMVKVKIKIMMTKMMKREEMMIKMKGEEERRRKREGQTVEHKVGRVAALVAEEDAGTTSTVVEVGVEALAHGAGDRVPAKGSALGPGVETDPDLGDGRATTPAVDQVDLGSVTSLVQVGRVFS